MLKIIEKTKIWFAISIVLIVIGMGSLFVNGLNFGIDFNGGTVVTIEMGEKIIPETKSEIDTIIQKYDKNATSNTSNETQIEIKSNSLDENTTNDLFEEIKTAYNLEDADLLSQSNVGPAVGKELKSKALKALVIAVLAMLAYIAIRFEFKFGIAAVIALLHDILITLGVYALFRVPLNTPFIAAMLTILGYSINDTIVIFDRIRENTKNMKGKSITEVTNISVTQTMSRSINTVLTTLITIVSVYIFVPAVRDFTFPLIVGILSGAYSSIFIASPVWVLLKKQK
ncbi:protein translocase subunit SecF [Clostridium grantii]|uniref:Protein-export membrane protein SecF n=1 Tax=Clostridium grantii DSM 8605 TaxID=1121316 RepID=A0A1M5SL99_9CLOT|nr:protein translocase subunit SecF [Clostridium grantii]SHH38683.1 protein translocase subunit secF [Clostridium grantii DSM 8605]